ncbi:DUF4435 domain-containing protein [Pseudomonas sp. GL-B-19]|uniref:DUF4435 domain-containing protein n=1 Tax=Pseudomonas sp. GL-B-19 TaxID=2832393 RepID=UPI001CBD00AC|nr:DUF4435 domain-containing protein [Pseudomonas sp. GL-B-19]
MSSRVDTLLESLDDTEVFFLEYSRIRSHGKAIFIIEGKDDPKFYTSKISTILGDLWDAVSVGGKSKVLELRMSIRNHPSYKTDKVFFLMDRDFDTRILGADIYTTPSYSIENIYCDPTTIRNLIVGECGLSNYKIQRRLDIITFVVQEYERLRAIFHRSKKLIIANSVFLYVRKEMHAKKISLDKVLKIEVKIADENLIVKLSRKSEYKAVRLAEKTKFREFLVQSPQLKEILRSPEMLFRGKQEILFLREFIKLLKEDSSLSKNVFIQFGHKLKLENPSMADHVLSSLAQYVRTPDCLIDFLGRSKEITFS